MRRFYSRVNEDPLLGPVFNDVAQVDWSEHLPKLTAFWCRILFGTPGFAGAPMRAHMLVHVKSPLGHEHFRRWVELFVDTVDSGWTGSNAERVKEFAGGVARAHSQHLIGTPVDLGARGGGIDVTVARSRTLDRS
ncbi:MAG: group III truncated hemoglobin, partial [Miltoncostaeaceae bacterium]